MIDIVLNILRRIIIERLMNVVVVIVTQPRTIGMAGLTMTMRCDQVFIGRRSIVTISIIGVADGMIAHVGQ